MSKLARFAILLVCIFAGALVFVFLFISHARNSDFRTAEAWHQAHGDTIPVGDHRLKLPQDWWVKSDSEKGEIFIVKASRDLTHRSDSGISIHRKGVRESKSSEDEIRKTLELWVDSDKKVNGASQSSVVVVKTVSTKLYCLKRSPITNYIELRCDVTDAPFVLKSIGPPETEKEIEIIFSTFE